MKGKVLYLSKYGSCRQYAEWISRETGFDNVDLAKEKRPDLRGIDVVVIGGWILADRMKTSSYLKKNVGDLLKRKVILFSTSASKPSGELKRKYLENSVPGQLRNDVEYFPLQGRFKMEDLNFTDRTMMKAASKIFGDDELVKNLVKGVDGVRKENLGELLDHINGI